MANWHNDQFYRQEAEWQTQTCSRKSIDTLQRLLRRCGVDYIAVDKVNIGPPLLNPQTFDIEFGHSSMELTFSFRNPVELEEKMNELHRRLEVTEKLYEWYLLSEQRKDIKDIFDMLEFTAEMSDDR